MFVFILIVQDRQRSTQSIKKNRLVIARFSSRRGREKIFLQEQQSAALAAYFNKTEAETEADDDNAWGDMKGNDWGDDNPEIRDEAEEEEEKWEDFAATSRPMTNNVKPSATATTTTMGTKSTGASWAQDKPAANQSKKNDWDTDAFFNDVLTSSSKPKLKTSRN